MSAKAKTIIIGVVAAPAGGKSTVAGHLASLGATWINADQIAHEVLQYPEIAAQVIQHFGAAIVAGDGKIDRAALGRQVFKGNDRSKKELKYLESIIHPETRKIILQRITEAQRDQSTGVVLDVPLLFESGWSDQCDEVWFIDTPDSIRISEAKRRGWTIEKLNLREANQLSVVEKRRRSTRLIPNDGTLESLKKKVEKIWADCVQSAAVDAVQSTSVNHCHLSPPQDY